MRVAFPHQSLDRSTIFRQMIAIGCVAVILGFFRESLVVGLTFCFCLIPISLAFLSVRGLSVPPSRLFACSAAWINVSLLVWVLFHEFIKDLNILVYLSVLLVPIFLGSGLKWANTQVRRDGRIKANLPVATLLAIALSMVLTLWPLRLAFTLSSPALNRLADRVEAGETVSDDEWSGFYPVRGARVDSYGGKNGVLLTIHLGGRLSTSLFRESVLQPPAANSRENLSFGYRADGRWFYLGSERYPVW